MVGMRRKLIRASRFGVFILLSGGCAAEPVTETGAVTEEVTAESGTTAWSYRVAGTQRQQVNAVASAPQSGAYIAGSSEASVYYRDQKLPRSAISEAAPFVARLDANGGLVWGHVDPGPAGSAVTAMGSNAAGDVAVGGSATGPVDLAGCVEPADSGASSTIWYASFDASGGCRSGRTFVNAGYEPSTGGVALLPDGGVAIAGGVRGALDFDGVVLTGPGSVGVSAPFVAVIDADGAVRWAKAFQPTQLDGLGGWVSGLDVDASGRLYLAGTVHEAIDFDGTVIAPAGPDPRTAAFVAVLEPDDGAVVRAAAYGSKAIALDIAVQPDGTAAVSGSFTRSVSFPGGVSVSTPGGFTDGFVVKMNPDGVASWARHLWGTSEIISPNGVSIDSNGFVGVAGSMNIGTLHISDYVFTSRSGDAFAARFGSATGSTVWATAFPGIIIGTSGWGVSGAADVAATDNRRLVVGGSFGFTTDFGNRTLTSNGGDGFVLRLYP